MLLQSLFPMFDIPLLICQSITLFLRIISFKYIRRQNKYSFLINKTTKTFFFLILFKGCITLARPAMAVHSKFDSYIITSLILTAVAMPCQSVRGLNCKYFWSGLVLYYWLVYPFFVINTYEQERLEGALK
jgi:hypothetical protein